MSEQLSFELLAAPIVATVHDDPSPPDAAARERITTDLGSNLFVEAGAGAGKTTQLVGRVLALVRSGVPIMSIAAITFTEKAAADLRHRLRHDLTAAEESADEAPESRRLIAAALDDLDHAPIGTLHAFARRLLYEFPIEAGLPPGFTVRDELESDLAFHERWEDLLDRLLEEPDPPAGAIDGGSEFVQLCEFDGFGVRRGVRRVAEDFQANWDLVDDRVVLDPPPRFAVDTEPIRVAAEQLGNHEAPEDDTQHEALTEIADLARALVSGNSIRTRLDAVVRIAGRCHKAGKGGNKTKWKQHGGPAALDALRNAERDVASEADLLIRQVEEYRQCLLGALVGRFVLDGALARASDGTLEFHDLLVFARRLLATRADVRALLHARYQRVLLDEFQDTDPIQLEIAVRLTARPDDPAHDTDWRQLRPVPARLFIVGDPKQSIYRFRRADIAQYLRAAEQTGAETALLSANFRSSSAVIDWVNHVFSELIVEQPDVQPAYHALEVCRPRHRGHGSVHVLGSDVFDELDSRRGDAEGLRSLEAAAAADAVVTALVDGWLVENEKDEETLRRCRPGDITVLLPARTSLPALEAALRERDVPYRAENSSVVYTTTEIRHLMLALRAADDPTDELALVAALRSPLYGCSDVELYEWATAGGRWNLWVPPPEALAEHPVAEAIAHLRSIATRISWRTPADLLAEIVDERRVLDVALDSPDANDVWRRVRYVIDQARAWGDVGGHGVRRYLAWARLQASEGRIADTILPEHDHDAVRIMTIHAAKGLEFPITVVSGLTTKPQRGSSTGVVWPTGTWTLAGREGDDVYDEFKPIDEQMSDAERRRLLYVACTRAIDHLVVSLHRGGQLPELPGKYTSAELLASAGAADPAAGARELVATAEPFTLEQTVAVELPWADAAAWAAERTSTLARASIRTTISATRLAEDLAGLEGQGDPGLRKDPVDLDLPPWQRGRYGTAIGRAVHGVLQFADLQEGGDIDRLADAQCAAEGILGMSETVAALARSALAAPIVRSARDLEHHRELFVAAEIDGRVLEGYIDLLVRTADGLVIVDYKTDQWIGTEMRDERVARYRRQLAAYGVAIERVLGEPVVGGVLVRCRVGEAAEEIPVDDWRDAVEALAGAVRQRV
ncbi:MAG TPA: UvrD-helicase domain-containing protein [Ilumatobacteraceae bacterium]|nr:UvrD-helicase domain-containing protein [Ilumatobacteraceae bacterium]